VIWRGMSGKWSGRWRGALRVVGMCCLQAALPARADDADHLQISGRVQGDLRVRPTAIGDGAFYNRRSLPAGIARNRNLFKLRLSSEFSEVAAVADIDFVWFGLLKSIDDFADLTRRDRIDPYFIRANAAYVQVHDFLTSGLDLRLGQQLVNWGKGDQFNPTNTINANDFSDPLQFGQQVANSMLRVDYSPQGTWTLSGVLVPIFNPAVLPLSAPLALSNTSRIPIADPGLRRRIVAQQHAAQDATGLFPRIDSAAIELPSPALSNMQFALRAAFSMYRQDAALSFYHGRSDMPLPRQETTTPQVNRQCDPQNPTSCINGTFETAVVMHYPRMQVFGINVAGEVPLLGFLKDEPPPFGYHVELALVSPERSSLRIFANPGAGLPGGEYAYGGDGKPPELVGETPFLKWNLGLDYTLLRRFYVNLQWLHGFFDEFGAGDFMHPSAVPILSSVATPGCDDADRCVNELVRSRLGDYIVLGSESKWFSDALLARFFIIYDLTPIVYQSFNPRTGRRVSDTYSIFSGRGASAVLFPELTYNVGGGLDLSIGALANLGRSYTKFGDPAVGGTEIWTRARYSY
jgi:hypothetical protein